VQDVGAHPGTFADYVVLRKQDGNSIHCVILLTNRLEQQRHVIGGLWIWILHFLPVSFRGKKFGSSWSATGDGRAQGFMQQTRSCVHETMLVSLTKVVQGHQSYMGICCAGYRHDRASNTFIDRSSAGIPESARSYSLDLQLSARARKHEPLSYRKGP